MHFYAFLNEKVYKQLKIENLSSASSFAGGNLFVKIKERE